MGDPDLKKTPRIFEIKASDKAAKPIGRAVLEVKREFGDALKIVDDERVKIKIFPEKKYDYVVYNQNGEKIVTGEFDPRVGREITLPVKVRATETTIPDLLKYIEQISTGFDYDDKLDSKLKVLRKIANYRVGSKKRVRGGRFEELFFLTFKKFKGNGWVDQVIWNGNLNEHGVPSPAPGGSPDILVKIGDTLFVFEVTLIGDTRMQWSQEGVSVPDHIQNMQSSHTGDVVGLFIAPEMHKDNKDALEGLSIQRGFNIVFKKTVDFTNQLSTVSSRKDLISILKSS